MDIEYVEHVARIAAENIRRHQGECIVNFTYGHEELMLWIDEYGEQDLEMTTLEDGVKYHYKTPGSIWFMCVDGKYYRVID